MYATSKLIIPAKISQDSPYVPKIRICLRPPASLDEDVDVGNSMGSNECTDEKFKPNYDNIVCTERNDDIHSTEDSVMLTTNTTEMNKPQDATRNTRRRKFVGNLDNIGIDRKDSLLTKINLKKIINMETFESLPLDSRRKLLNLLPVYDRTRTNSTSDDSELLDYWIHPTSLNNEFLSKALQDYSIRQINGDFTPCSNLRQGLRKSVGNRLRYLNPCAPHTSLPLSPLQLTSVINKDDEPDEAQIIISNGSMDTTSLKTPILRYQNAQQMLVRQKLEATEENDGSQFGQDGICTRSSRKRKAVPKQTFCFSPSSSTSSSTPTSPRCPALSSPSVCLSLSANPIAFSSLSPIFVSEPMASRPSPILSESTTLWRHNMPKLESTLLHDGINPSSRRSVNSQRRSTIDIPRRRLSQPGQEHSSTSRHPLVVDSSTPTTPNAMPPPRETKTLASVREKLRAKRIMLSKNPIHSPTQVPADPPIQQPTTDLPSNGSLTPDPGTSYSGDFYSNPIASRESVPPVSSPEVPQPFPLPPMGNSVSAPATPQHSSVGGVAPGHLPAILANFKQARVVVAPSLSVSGSSVSSNEGLAESLEASNQSSETPAQQQATQQQHQQASVAVPLNGSGIVGGGGGGSGTTTRAFFVDGNDLSETLARLQSMNPQATVTQQQFLLIPSTDKSHAILCRTPIAIQPKQAQPIQSSQPQVVRRPSGSSNVPPPPVLPLILSANRSQDHQLQQTPTYREILPNNSCANAAGVSRIPQPQGQPSQQLTQVRPSPTFYSLLAPSPITTSAVIKTSNSGTNQPAPFLPRPPLS